MRYKVVLYESEEGFAASRPGLPGCCSQGETEAEAIQNIQSAIEDYLAAIDQILQTSQAGTVREVEVAA
jgi:predicted RNase H-like HicB family nuclease